MKLILYFLVFINLYILASSETRMILVYGEPDSEKYTKQNGSLTWDECINTCLISQECVMAWQSNETCIIYKYYSISSVSQTDASYGSIVAWKIDIPDGQCPTGTNPPTFDNQNATGQLFVDYDKDEWPMYVNYNIYLDGNKWKVSYSVNRSCSTNFMDIINHPDGSGICVTEWYSKDDGTFSFNKALQLCQQKTALLADLVYPEDFVWFQNSVSTTLRPLLYSPDSYARVDGKRTVVCQATPSTPECMSVKGFHFVGPPVPHFYNYNWVTNSAAMATPDDNCLVVVFKGNETPKVDVRGCTNMTSPLDTRLVFCSDPAWTLDAVDYD